MTIPTSRNDIANPAELKVYSTIGVQGAIEELAPLFEKAGGHRLAINWATAPMLVKRILGGETADVMILNLAGIDTMIREGRIAPGSGVKLASSAVAIAVKAGAVRPDISSPGALKQTLLNARSISYTDPAAGGASGIYFAKLLERMGIADEINAKTRYPPPGGYSGNLLLTNEAELAIQQKPELMHIAGTEIVGPLPGDLNVVTVFAAGVWVDSLNREAAQKLVEFLRAPEAAAVFRTKGLDPL
jgi:molybdate transport system substrate-binding protein